MKDKCIFFGITSNYAFAVANVIIGVEKFSPNLVENYIIFSDIDDPINDDDITALQKISNKIIIREFKPPVNISAKLASRFSRLYTAKFHIFDLLKEYQQVLWLDADILINGDISEIFSYQYIAWRKTVVPFTENIASCCPDIVVRNDATAPNAGVILANYRVLGEIDYTQKLYEYLVKLADKSNRILLDELSFGIVADHFNLKVDLLPNKYNIGLTWKNVDEGHIIHSIGKGKFWNHSLINMLYPEWNINHEIWLANGGSNYSGKTQFDDILGNKRESKFRALKNMFFWSKIIKNIILPSDIIAENVLHKRYLRFYIAGLDHKIHYELLLKKDKLYCCLHCEEKELVYISIYDTLNKIAQDIGFNCIDGEKVYSIEKQIKASNAVQTLLTLISNTKPILRDCEKFLVTCHGTYLCLSDDCSQLIHTTRSSYRIVCNVSDNCTSLYVNDINKYIEKIDDNLKVNLSDNEKFLPVINDKSSIIIPVNNKFLSARKSGEHIKLVEQCNTWERFNIRQLYMNLSFDDLCTRNYEGLDNLSKVINRRHYNCILDHIFGLCVKKIKQKEVIKIGFVLYDSSMWCGDNLYNLFKENNRYKVTVFLCLRMDEKSELIMGDYRRGLELLKKQGINVVGIDSHETKIPKQDILFYLTPYFHHLPQAFRLESITIDSLLLYLLYSVRISIKSPNMNIYHLAWKIFFNRKNDVDLFKEKCNFGMERGYYCGHPKMDRFFSGISMDFTWKQSLKNAKKIIYAPHWSINGGPKINYSTFHYNYNFIYNYAKEHPETSWIFKPHPQLMYTAVSTGVFPSIEAFQEYLNKWNDLPNAMVYTGAYYHPIFSTSDGMITDSGSFMAEYQYTHKPMLHLDRETQKYNDLGNALMKVLYHVDGRDFDGIANFIETVLLQNKDDLYNARMQLFDEYLNYKKNNGMLASEFIYNTINNELM